MGHEILGERFWGRQDEPAWHKLGKTPGRGVFMTAEQVLAEIGEPSYSLMPCFTVDPVGRREDLPLKAIYRHPVEEDPAYRQFGTVGPDYRLMVPGIVAVQFDLAMQGLPSLVEGAPFVPVETMGILRAGRSMFLTTEVKEIAVAGDPVTTYLTVEAPMDGGAVKGFRSGVRAVCQNTLTWAEERGYDFFRVVHGEGAEERFRDWLRELYAESVAKVEVARESFEILAAWKPGGAVVEEVLACAYPNPSKPREDAPPKVMEMRRKYHERNVRLAARKRDAVLELWEGKGTGMDHPAARGTGWGLWQSVVQLEDRRTGSFAGGEGDELNVAEAAIFGPRAETKRRTYSKALELIGAGR
jgi:hypothetical protein